MSCATPAQTAKNNQRPKDWPSQIPEQPLHGRMVQAKLVLIYPPDATNQDPSVVRIRIGVTPLGDVRTMKVLSGDKELVKDAKTLLVKTKFPEAPKPDAVAIRDQPPDYDSFSTPAAKTKPYETSSSQPVRLDISSAAQ